MEAEHSSRRKCQLTETWLNINMLDSAFQLDRMLLFLQIRISGQGKPEEVDPVILYYIRLVTFEICDIGNAA